MKKSNLNILDVTNILNNPNLYDRCIFESLLFWLKYNSISFEQKYNSINVLIDSLFIREKEYTFIENKDLRRMLVNSQLYLIFIKEKPKFDSVVALNSVTKLKSYEYQVTKTFYELIYKLAQYYDASEVDKMNEFKLPFSLKIV